MSDVSDFDSMLAEAQEAQFGNEEVSEPEEALAESAFEDEVPEYVEDLRGGIESLRSQNAQLARALTWSLQRQEQREAARLQAEAQAGAPPIPDKDEEPISWQQYQMEQLQNRMDQLSQVIQGQHQIAAQGEARKGFENYITNSEAEVTNPDSETFIPDYREAMTYLYQVEIEKWKLVNPNFDEASIRREFNNWWVGFALEQMQAGNYLPYVQYQMALNAGWRPPEQEEQEVAENDQRVLDMRQHLESRRGAQVPDIPSGGRHTTRSTAEPHELDDFSNMTTDEYNEWAESQGGLKGVIRNISKLAAQAG